MDVNAQKSITAAPEMQAWLESIGQSRIVSFPQLGCDTVRLCVAQWSSMLILWWNFCVFLVAQESINGGF